MSVEFSPQVRLIKGYDVAVKTMHVMEGGNVRTQFSTFLRSIVVIITLSSCAKVDVDSIGLHHSVVKGGQAEIDAGNVVDVNGLPGVWLAGHHTTHGAVFRNLGNVHIGDTVCVYSKCYTVFNIIIVPTTYKVTSEIAPVVLQTSWYGNDLLVLAR